MTWIWKNDENRERLAAFCGNSNLVIGGSIFKHRDIHKITSTSQMQEIGIKSTISSLMADTGVCWWIPKQWELGADANSDYHMVMGKVRLKLCSTKGKRLERTTFNIKRLRDPCVKEVIRLAVSNQFQLLRIVDTDDTNINYTFLTLSPALLYNVLTCIFCA